MHTLMMLCAIQGQGTGRVICQNSRTLNLAKCELCNVTVKYLGKEVDKGTVRRLESKVKVIVNFSVLPIKRDLQQFLGMAGYYRSFCKNFFGCG